MKSCSDGIDITYACLPWKFSRVSPELSTHVLRTLAGDLMPVDIQVVTARRCDAQTYPPPPRPCQALRCPNVDRHGAVPGEAGKKRRSNQYLREGEFRARSERKSSTRAFACSFSVGLACLHALTVRAERSGASEMSGLSELCDL